MDEDEDIIFEVPTQRDVLILGILIGITFIVIASTGQEGKARAITTSMVALSFVFRVSWPVRKKPWFLLTMAVIAFVHLAAIFGINWSNEHYGGPTMFPIMFLDTLAIFAIVLGVHKIVVKSR